MVRIKNQNKIDRKKVLLLFCLLLLILSYVLVLYKMFSPKKTECTLLVQEEKYEKKNEIWLYYRGAKMKKITKKESFTSKDANLLDIKKTELEKKEYKVHVTSGKVKGSITEKEKGSYSTILNQLLEAGYTCKE